MSVSSSATSSARQFCSSLLTTSNITYYTAPPASQNVTSPSATAYIKEIILSNVSSGIASVTMYIVPSGGTAGISSGNCIMYQVNVNPNDTKILSGLNTMMSAGSTIQAFSSASTAITLYVSGVEVQ